MQLSSYFCHSDFDEKIIQNINSVYMKKATTQRNKHVSTFTSLSEIRYSLKISKMQFSASVELNKRSVPIPVSFYFSSEKNFHCLFLKPLI